MKASNVLKKAEAAGFQVSADDRDIILDGDAVLDDGLRQDIQANKQEILWLLRHREFRQLRTRATELASWMDSADAPIEERMGKIAEFTELIDRIAELQAFIDRYARDGSDTWWGKEYLLLFSQVLGEIVCVVRGSEVKPPEGMLAYPRYLFCEVKTLQGASDEQIRKVHKVKQVFSGQVMDSAKAKQRSKRRAS